MQRLVNAFAIAGLVTVAIEAVEPCAFRQDELLLPHEFVDEFRLPRIFLFVGGAVILPYIRDVFQEQHGQDVILVDRCVDCPVKGVARRPGGLVDVVLRDLIAEEHG